MCCGRSGDGDHIGVAFLSSSDIGVAGAVLGIASADFFTAHDLMPMAKAGFIAVEGGEKNRYVPDKRYRLRRKEKAEVCA